MIEYNKNTQVPEHNKEKTTNIAFYQSAELLERAAKNNLSAGFAISGMIAGIGLIGLIGVNSSVATKGVLPQIDNMFVYVLLLLVNCLHLNVLLITRRMKKLTAKTKLNICYGNFLVNAFLSGMSLYSTQVGSSYFFELVLIMTVISLLPYYRFGRGMLVVAISALTTWAIIDGNRLHVAWQDFYDLLIFYVICIASIFLRRYWFKESSALNERLQLANSRFAVRSRTDDLTGLLNRTALREDFNDYQHEQVGMAMIDLDDFKQFNDQHGHSYGDRILAQIGQYMLDELDSPRISCYRYGGDEFLVIGIDMDPEMFKANLRKFQENYAFITEGQKTPATLSIGCCAGFLDSKHDLRSCLRLADSCLYDAKKRGKNALVAKRYSAFSGNIDNH